MFRLFLQLLRNEFVMLVSNRAVIFWSLLFPFFLMSIMLIAFGSRGGLGKVPVEIIDADQTAASHQYAAFLPHLFTTDALGISVITAAPSAVKTRLAADRVRVIIADGYGASQSDGKNHIFIEYDFNASLAVKSVARAIGSFGKIVDPQAKLTPNKNIIAFHNTGVSKAELTYKQYILSGVLIMSLMSTGILTTAIALATSRENLLLKYQACSPMPKSLFMTTFLASRMILNTLSAIVLLLGGYLFFDVTYNISLICALQSIALMIIGTMLFLSLGLLLGARTSSIGAATLIGNLVYFPLIFLGDLTIPLKAFPNYITKILDVLPLHILVTSLRNSLFLGVANLTTIGTGMEVTAWSCILFYVAVRLFRWTDAKS